MVLDDGPFLAFQMADVPGWIMLATKDHVEGVDGLPDATADALGLTTRRVVTAIKRATEAERVHVVYIGEHARHFHLALLPRRSGEPALVGNERMLAAIDSDADPAGSASVRIRIRDLIGSGPAEHR
jgi:diadenosine tetraphosphate (Ap4A) HIT family hydrolase